MQTPQLVLVDSQMLSQIITMQKEILANLTNEEDDELITREEASKFLKCDIQTIDNLRREGVLHDYGRGKLVRLKKSELLKK